MKYLIILVFLSGCTFVKSSCNIPSFKIGDCIAQDSQILNYKRENESWEPKKELEMDLIIEIGKFSYRTIHNSNFDSKRYYELSIEFKYDLVLSKVECSNNLKQIKKEKGI